MEDFKTQLLKLGGRPTEDTIYYQNTRLADKYLIFDLLALGKHSTIYYGIEEVTGKERVFKVYNLRELENTLGFKQKELCKRLSNYEYELARKCDSIHILHVYDIYEDRNCKIIVTEYCNLGSLAAEIKARKNRGTDQLKAIAIIKQIISGLRNIHKNCAILHKNLKSKNVLIQDGIYKIIDFGLPSLFSEEDEQALRVPELIMKRGYDQKAEVWSVGVLFHQILFGEQPRALVYSTKNYLISNGVKTIFESDGKMQYDKEVGQFLHQCLQTHPQDRMTWQQLQQHPIFELIMPSLPKNIPLSQHQQDNRMSVVIPISEENSIDLSQGGNNQNLAELPLEDEAFYQQKFVLQQEARAIEKKIEQSYQKLGNYLQISQLEPVSWEPLRLGIDRRSHVQYQQLKDYYLQCLKVDFVYYDIICILKKNLNYESNRQHIEFLYLLFSRCFFEMSQLHLITQEGGFQSRAQNVLIACIKRQTQALYAKVKSGWDDICNIMQNQENRLINRLFDGLSKVFKGKDFKRKDELLTGIEGPDFSKQDQIGFTVEMYSEYIRKDLLQQVKEQSRQGKNCQLAVNFLDKYEQMWEIKVLDETYLSIKDYMFAICQSQKA